MCLPFLELVWLRLLHALLVSLPLLASVLICSSIAVGRLESTVALPNPCFPARLAVICEVEHGSTGKSISIHESIQSQLSLDRRSMIILVLLVSFGASATSSSAADTEKFCLLILVRLVLAYASLEIYLMPVLVLIHSSFVSTSFSRSMFVNLLCGTLLPTPVNLHPVSQLQFAWACVLAARFLMLADAARLPNEGCLACRLKFVRGWSHCCHA